MAGERAEGTDSQGTPCEMKGRMEIAKGEFKERFDQVNRNCGTIGDIDQPRIYETKIL